MDAMGGDYAPEEIIKGVLQVASSIQGQILLVGRKEAIEKYLPSPTQNIAIIPATDVIEMHDSPVESVLKKKDSSLLKAVYMVRDGTADALVTAGNTGAAAAACHIILRCLPRINRPAIATTFPSKKDRFVVLDSGATPDADVRNLLEFAVMGSAYAETVLGKKEPRIGLLNIGEEATKGNILTKEAYKLLSKNLPNFAGNVEGKDIFEGNFDVVVCDGFVGNVLLKTAQGCAEWIKELIQNSFPRNPILKLIAYRILKPGLSRMMKSIDYAEIGGAPLLGVNGLCVIAHGRSRAKAIRNAIMLVQNEYKGHLNELIKERIQHLQTEQAGAI